jgi:RNA polymerase sigma-70 factor (ECF subfamily)
MVTPDPLSQEQWRRWLVEHAPKLLLFARQKAASDADAQDLVQEALLECWQRNNAGTQRASSPSPPPLPLLFATIRRRAIDLTRREERRVNREQSVAADETRTWFDVRSEELEFARIIQGALAGLPAEQREVITLKVWGDLTFSEIGEALGIPANTAASRYRYGLAELRRLTKQVLA